MVIDGIKVTECITFPRSGHTWLAAVLADYFGDRWHYCESHQDPIDRRIGPATNTNFQKNHDFLLDVPILDGRQYLIQARNPFCNLPSWRKLDEHDSPDDRPPLQAQTRERLTFWHDWVQKWIMALVPIRHLVFYEELTRRPFLNVCHIIRFLDAGEALSLDKAMAALRRHPLDAGQNHSERHYEAWREMIAPADAKAVGV